jgi:hypothetical protein
VNIEIHVAAKTTFGAPQWFEDFLVQENLHRSEYRAMSNYYPSATFRIAVYDPKDQEQFSEYFGKQQIFTAKVPDDYVGEEG